MHVGFFLSKASVPVKTMILFAEWALCTKVSDGTKSPLLDGKLRTGTSKTKGSHALLVEIALFWRLLHSFSIQHGGFIPCDGIMQKAHSGASITKSADKLSCQLLKKNLYDECGHSLIVRNRTVAIKLRNNIHRTHELIYIE